MFQVQSTKRGDPSELKAIFQKVTFSHISSSQSQHQSLFQSVRHWSDGVRAHLGTTLSLFDYPSAFILYIHLCFCWHTVYTYCCWDYTSCKWSGLTSSARQMSFVFYSASCTAWMCWMDGSLFWKHRVPVYVRVHCFFFFILIHSHNALWMIMSRLCLPAPCSTLFCLMRVWPMVW